MRRCRVPHRVRVSLGLALAPALGLAGVLACMNAAEAGDKSKAPPKANLRESAIGDHRTTVSVPLSADTSIFIGLPPRLFIQCPRTSTIPTSLDGDGLILQDVWNTTTGNAHSIVYLGTVPLPKSDPSQSFADRVARFVPSFIAGMREKYSRVDFMLVTDARGIKLEKLPLKVDGKPAVAWRTSTYVTRPTVNVNKDAIFTGEAAFLGDPVSDALIYFVVDSKSRRVKLDQLLEEISIRKSATANPNGHLVQLNDISNALDNRYPIRLASFESPAGFVATQDTVRSSEVIVYSEQRLDEKGTVTAMYRIDHRDHGDTQTLAGELELERASRSIKASEPAKTIELATAGAQALVLSYKTKVGDRPAAAQTAVLALDDKIWIVTWTSFGDDAAVAADALAFEAMLRSMQLVVR